MKRFISVPIALTLMLSSIGSVSAADVNINNSEVKSEATKLDSKKKEVCNLNTSSIVINGKAVNVRTLTYKGRVYVPLNEICGFFNTSFKIDEKNAVLKIDTTSALGIPKLPSKKPAKEMYKRVEMFVQPYDVTVDGINEYLENLKVNNEVYVPIRYFAEIFQKSIEPQKDGKILINDINDVIATVNGENIQRWEFEYYYRLDSNQIELEDAPDKEQQLEDLRNKVFDYIVSTKIINQKAKEHNVILDETDYSYINKYDLDRQVSAAGGIDSLRRMLKESNLYYHHVAIQYKESYLVNKLLGNLTEHIVISDADVKKFYDENPQEFTEDDSVTAKHILIRTADLQLNPYDQKKKDEAKARAEELLGKIKKGEDFDKLMLENTEEPGTEAQPDGYTFTKGHMVKEFEDAAFSLKEGEVSGIVESEYGYHIIKLVKKTPGRVIPLDGIVEKVRSYLESIKKNEEILKLLDDWKAESKIENLMK